MPEQPCPKCGRPIDADKPCQHCLLQLAVEPTEDYAEYVSVTGSLISGEAIDLETLRTAFPQLEIIEPIGRGGMGTVFIARQPNLDRLVALKILSEQLAEKPTFAERFAREGKLLARLNHPNIVAVYDFGESGGFYYLLMEYVEGVNLRQAMREESFTPEQAIGIVPKICEALQYAHDEGVLHRDIKPENILLDTKGRVKIADFGIGKFKSTAISDEDASENSMNRGRSGQKNMTARSHRDLTQTGQILGTPSYMAPEQLDDPNRVDHRADIYSLGVVFYELLTGELPRGRFPMPSERSQVGADIDHVVLKALHKEREKRQQSAGEMKTEIETAAGMPDVEKLQQSATTLFPTFKKMSFWTAVLVAIGVMSAGPLLIGIAFQIIGLILGPFQEPPGERLYEILFSSLPILCLIALVWLLRNGALSREQMKRNWQSLGSFRETIIVVRIVLAGLVIPYLANLFGGYMHDFKPWFYGVDSIQGFVYFEMFQMIAVAAALVFYFASKTFCGFLKYVSTFAGYMAYCYFYLQTDFHSSSTAAIALIFIPIYSLAFFIVGYFLACIANYVIRKTAKVE